MDLITAMKSGRPFRQPGMNGWYTNDGSVFGFEDHRGTTSSIGTFYMTPQRALEDNWEIRWESGEILTELPPPPPSVPSYMIPRKVCEQIITAMEAEKFMPEADSSPITSDALKKFGYRLGPGSSVTVQGASLSNYGTDDIYFAVTSVDRKKENVEKAVELTRSLSQSATGSFKFIPFIYYKGLSSIGVSAGTTSTWNLPDDWLAGLTNETHDDVPYTPADGTECEHVWVDTGMKKSWCRHCSTNAVWDGRGWKAVSS